MIRRTHMSPCATQWADALLAAGFADGVRRNVLARVLEKNEFSNMRQRQYAEHPSMWLGSDRIQPDEVEWLVEFIVKQAAPVDRRVAEPPVAEHTMPASCSDRGPTVRAH